MTSVNATTARKCLYKYIVEVNENRSPITITNSRGKNAVLVSEEDWNAIQETLYLHSVSGMVKSILDCDKEEISEAAIYNPEEDW